MGWAVSILTQGRLSGLAKQLTNQLVSKGYSREVELEADRSAVEALQRAGFDPSIGIQVLSKLAEGKEDLSPAGEYFSTHPSTAERLRLLRSHIKRLEGGK
jgi:predicted Zn-dependent protease